MRSRATPTGSQLVRRGLLCRLWVTTYALLWMPFLREANLRSTSNQSFGGLRPPVFLFVLGRVYLVDCMYNFLLRCAQGGTDST